MSPVTTTATFVRPHLNNGYGKHNSEGVNTLPELIEFVAKHNPDYIFGLQFRSGEGVLPHEITCSQLQDIVKSTAAWLIRSGCTQQRISPEVHVPPVGIFLGSDISILIYMAALMRIGAPVFLLSARLAPAALAHLLIESGAGSVLVSSQLKFAVNKACEVLQSGGHSSPKFIDALDVEELLDLDLAADAPPSYAHHRVEDLGAFILHSSGSTDFPKLLYHSISYILVQASCHRFPKQNIPFRFNVSGLPLYHGFGLIPPLLSLSIGMPIVLPPSSLIPTAKSIYSLILSTNAGYLLSVPSIVEDMLRLTNGVGLEVMQQLEIVAVGGAPLKESVGHELMEAGVKLINHWGCTEIGALTPIERIPKGYTWPYFMLRQDTDLHLIPVDEATKTYRLVGRAPGWNESHTIEDLLTTSPDDPRLIKILRRSDDVIVLSTGEKIQPAMLENAMAEHPRVSNAIAFGEGQLYLGLLLELFSSNSSDGDEDLLSQLEPYLERGNGFMDSHGKVSREMIIFTRQDVKPFHRTAKGNIAKKVTYSAFETEITACYRKASLSDAIPLPHPHLENGDALLRFLRTQVSAVMDLTEPLPFADDKDFFEVGMDSLQATRLRRTLLTGLTALQTLSSSADALDPEFCFENSSIFKLFRSLSCIMLNEGLTNINSEENRLSRMHQIVEDYSQKLSSIDELISESSVINVISQENEPGKVVILTGSTGSLGCFIFANLAKDPAVSKIICLNRSSPNIQQRQESLCNRRGAFVSQNNWNKVVFYEVDLNHNSLGLEREDYEKLFQASLIIHSAWPVNFNRNLSSLEPHIQGVANLIRLSLLSGLSRRLPTRFMFVSSISVVGRYPSCFPKEPLIPEQDVDAVSTLPMGYAEAKWVCERLLKIASDKYKSHLSFPVPFEGTSIRVGQMSGAEASGAWNEDEHIPIIFRTSSALKCLPNVEGTLSWMPVNLAADTVVDISCADELKPFYHLENPCRQPWSDVLRKFSAMMGTPQNHLSIVPFSDWFHCISTLGDDAGKNPALKILGFLEQEFISMAEGKVVLNMSNTLTESKTLRAVGPLDEGHFEKYIKYWKITC